MPNLVLTAYAACGLLVRAQEVVPAPNPLSAQSSLRPADRLGQAGLSGAREQRGYDDLALLCMHALGRQRRVRAILDLTSSQRPVL